MMDVQGEERHIFSTAEARSVLRSHRIGRVMVGIHGGNTTQHVVEDALREAGYTILVSESMLPLQPDGAVIAIAPRESAPLNFAKREAARDQATQHSDSHVQRWTNNVLRTAWMAG